MMSETQKNLSDTIGKVSRKCTTPSKSEGIIYSKKKTAFELSE